MLGTGIFQISTFLPALVFSHGGTIVEKKICLNLSALIHLDFEEQLRVSSQAGFQAVGIREVNLINYLSSGKTLKDAGMLLDQYGLKSIEYNYFSNWIFADSEERTKMTGRFDFFCQSAVMTGENQVLVAPVSYENKNDLKDNAAAVRNLKEIGNIARSYNTRVAVEFLPWTQIDSIESAWDIVHEVDMENVGIVLDTFHYFEGRSTVEGLHLVPVDKIFICHIDDMDTVEGDLLTRTREHRVLPGEGKYHFDEVLSYLEGHNYGGYYSLEILNKDYYKKDPLELALSAKRSMEDLLYQ